MKLGVLGGTFDPIHGAHLVLAEEARRCLALERVVFVPAGDPWRKGGQPITLGEHRLAMVRLAVADNPFFEVSTTELTRKGPSYTAETLDELRRERGVGTELYFIVGEDALQDLPHWKDPGRIIAQAWLAVARRGSWEASDVEAVERAVPGITRKLVTFEMPRMDISATELRKRAAAGQSLRYLVPVPVEEYIRRHRLYVTPD